MARPASKHPTELELEILKVLWEKSPLSVREVREALLATRRLAYTSVMTIMNIMVDKGYLRREKEGPSFVYEPVARRDATVRRMLKDLVDRVFNGSAAAAMVNLLESSDLDKDELQRLRKLLKSRPGGNTP
jgi:predicted transcriptional regulator